MNSGLQSWLRTQRAVIERDLQTIGERRYFSAVFYGMYEVIVPMIMQYVGGRLIDLGCGSMPFRHILAPYVTRIHGLDRFVRVDGSGADASVLEGDIQQMGMLRSASYDSAICIEVLEHIPNPCQAVAEIARILKPGGILILSVPHLSRLHDLPHDYYRYTEMGLRHLLMQNSFDLIEVRTRGGLFSFLSHQVSTILVSIGWGVPVIQQILWTLNRGLAVSTYRLDQVMGTATTFPLGYVVVARNQQEQIGPNE